MDQLCHVNLLFSYAGWRLGDLERHHPLSMGDDNEGGVISGRMEGARICRGADTPMAQHTRLV